MVCVCAYMLCVCAYVHMYCVKGAPPPPPPPSGLVESAESGQRIHSRLSNRAPLALSWPALPLPDKLGAPMCVHMCCGWCLVCYMTSVCVLCVPCYGMCYCSSFIPASLLPTHTHTCRPWCPYLPRASKSCQAHPPHQV